LGEFNYGEAKNTEGTELGPYKLDNGAVYEGNWLKGARHGRGK